MFAAVTFLARTVSLVIGFKKKNRSLVHQYIKYNIIVIHADSIININNNTSKFSLCAGFHVSLSCQCVFGLIFICISGMYRRNGMGSFENAIVLLALLVVHNVNHITHTLHREERQTTDADAIRKMPILRFATAAAAAVTVVVINLVNFFKTKAN